MSDLEALVAILTALKLALELYDRSRQNRRQPPSAGE
jgi:hypothetical protein